MIFEHFSKNNVALAQKVSKFGRHKQNYIYQTLFDSLGSNMRETCRIYDGLSK
jgi:hypothetical protein